MDFRISRLVKKISSCPSAFTIQHVKFLKLYLVASFLFLFSACFSQKAIPELWGQRVHDEAHALKQTTIDQLEKELKVYEDSTSNQLAVLIIQSLDGDVIEEYSLKVVEKWQLGTKSKDNGMLLLIAIDDHKMRIEVGQGLQGVLTDALCSRIIRNEMAPNFRRDDYDTGLLAAITAIQKAIGGEYSSDEDATWSIGNIIFLSVFISIFLFIIGLAFYKEFKGSSGLRSSKGSKTRYSSIGSSSSSDSSSSSSSSFSGGGGSFDGGGSSGSW